MKFERFVQVEDNKIFKEEIAAMNNEQLSALCSFMDKESDLLFIQQHCSEGFKHKIDNLISKIQ